jgi:hypothetical protein
VAELGFLMGQAFGKIGGNAASDHPLTPFTKFTDLYEDSPWEEKMVAKLVISGTLAPIVKGTESKEGDTEECPICFLNNSQVLKAAYFVTDFNSSPAE